jgi:hypothetical protein
VRIYRKIRTDTPFLGVVFRFLLEGYLDFLFAGILTAELISKTDLMFSNKSDGISFTLGLLFFLGIVALPIVAVWGIKKKIYFLDKIVMENYSSEEELYQL